MVYNQQLASRVEKILDDLQPPELTNKKMFGGVCYLIQGNIACGILQEKMRIRVGKHAFSEALAKPGTAPFDINGRPMAGWVFVEPPEFVSDDDLLAWVHQGFEFALTLPKK